MRRVIFQVSAPVVVASALLAWAVPAAAERTWRPKAIFTSALCNKELKSARAALEKRMADEGITAPSSAADDPQVVKKYENFLARVDKETRRRAAAQENAAGKWKGPTRYESIRWFKQLAVQPTVYHITSCQIAEKKIPLNRALAVVKAVPKPTEVDQVIAELIGEYVKAKKARKACRKIRPFSKGRSCLAQYHDLQWLDRYPMD